MAKDAAAATRATGDATTQAARELYALPREQFVAKRNARAKALRADGDREAADAVKALAKPTLLAWAIDQAVRVHADEAEALMETIAAMQSPDSVDELRELAERHEQLVHELARAADGAVGGSRAPDLAAAIRVAAISADAQRFIDGTLADTPRAGEDTLMAALAAGARMPARPPRRTKTKHTDPAAPRRASERRRKLRDAISDARTAQRDAARELRDAAREVTRLERELEQARRRASAAAEARDDADATLRSLGEELDALDD